MGREPIPRSCLICGKFLGFGGKRKYCEKHLKVRIEEFMESMIKKKGKDYRKWKTNWEIGMKQIEENAELYAQKWIQNYIAGVKRKVEEMAEKKE